MFFLILNFNDSLLRPKQLPIIKILIENISSLLRPSVSFGAMHPSPSAAKPKGGGGRGGGGERRRKLCEVFGGLLSPLRFGSLS